MKITNEELAVNARNHDEWATLELWEAVRRFVSQEAYKYLQRGENSARVEYDDLMQSGFLAMLDAVRIYDPERESNFLTVMKWAIKSRFAEAGGHRSSKRDPLFSSDSLDISAYKDDPESESAGDMIADPCSEYAFIMVEYEDFREYCNKLIFAALELLTPSQRALIIRHYFGRQTLESIGRGELARQNVSSCIKRGLRRMKHGKYHRELREALQGFGDFRELDAERGRLDLKSLELRKEKE